MRRPAVITEGIEKGTVGIAELNRALDTGFELQLAGLIRGERTGECRPRGASAAERVQQTGH